MRAPGKIRTPCMIRGACAAKRAPPWQDLRAMHSRTAVCGAFRIHGARILPKPARFGCMAAICCQGGALFPSGAPSGMHEARKLSRMAARERTTAKTCHRQAPGNAFREHPAVAELPRAHRGRTLPWRRPPWNVPRRNIAAAGRWGQLARHVRRPGFTGLARKAASQSGSTRKADSLAGIRKSSAQGMAAHQVCEAARRAHQVRTPGSKGSSTRTARPHAKFAKRLDVQGQQGTKRRRSEDRRLPRKTTGANQIRPES